MPLFPPTLFHLLFLALTGLYLAIAVLLMAPVPMVEHAIRLMALWFILLAFARIRGFPGGRDRVERAAEELARTHEQVRRYTADLEKDRAEKEKSLAEITLLHRFGSGIHALRRPEEVYDHLLSYLAHAAEAPWIILVHRRDTGGRLTLRSAGNPPAEAMEWARREAARAEGSGDSSLQDAVPGLGPCRVHLFPRAHQGASFLAALLIFPRGGEQMEEDQVKTVSVLMSRAESELDLIRVQGELTDANRRLSESNSQLLRLIDLENEFSRAFLERGDMPAIFQTLHEIMAKEIFEVDRLNLFLPNRGTGMLECATSVGIGDYPLEKVKVPLDGRGGALALAFLEGRSILFDGSGPVPPEYRLAEPWASIPPIRSRIFAIIPIVDHEGRSLGVIGADRKYTHRPIPPETVMMLEAFARHAALLFTLQGVKDAGAA